MKFKIGDRVRILPGSTRFDIGNGQIGTVIEITPNRPREVAWYGIFVRPGDWYTVEGIALPPPYEGRFHENRLELVPPDKEQTVKWHECAWSPRALPVFVPGDTKVIS